MVFRTRHDLEDVEEVARFGAGAALEQIVGGVGVQSQRIVGVIYGARESRGYVPVWASARLNWDYSRNRYEVLDYRRREPPMPSEDWEARIVPERVNVKQMYFNEWSPAVSG